MIDYGKDTDFYKVANADLTSYQREDVYCLAKEAHERGVRIHIEGLPFGEFNQPAETEA